MISSSVLACLRPAPQLRLVGRCLEAVGAPVHVRHASHKSAKAMKAMKSIRKAYLEPAKPTASKPITSKPKASKAKTTRPTPTEPAAEVVAEPPSTITPEPKYDTLAEQLANKDGPTLLYSKSHWKLVLACYAMAGTGILVAYSYYLANVVTPVGVPIWVPWVHQVGVICIGLGAVGFFAYPVRMIRSIHAIPYRLTPGSTPSIKLQIQSNNFLPFLPAIRTETTLDKIYLGRRLTPLSPPVEEQVPEGALKRFAHALSTAPARIFYSIKSTIKKENVVAVAVKSGHWKFKIRDDGWQWERKGLDRLIGTERKW